LDIRCAESSSHDEDGLLIWRSNRARFGKSLGNCPHFHRTGESLPLWPASRVFARKSSMVGNLGSSGQREHFIHSSSATDCKLDTEEFIPVPLGLVPQAVGDDEGD
jgi:hypothetical protein